MFLQRDEFRESLKTRLIGIVPGAYLIIATPESDGDSEIRAGGTEIIIRYIFRGEVMGFRSSVIVAIENPFRLTFISYPDRIESMSLRKEKRVDCSLPSMLTVENSEINGIVSDLSVGGCRFTAKLEEPPARGEFALDSLSSIVFSLPGSEGFLRIDGKIRNSVLSPDRVDLGIQFVKINPESKAQIEGYVQQIYPFL